jgi:hypothetical protein
LLELRAVLKWLLVTHDRNHRARPLIPRVFSILGHGSRLLRLRWLESFANQFVLRLSLPFALPLPQLELTFCLIIECERSFDDCTRVLSSSNPTFANAREYLRSLPDFCAQAPLVLHDMQRNFGAATEFISRSASSAFVAGHRTRRCRSSA